LEDFFSENGEVVFVSTIHKAKGKEFDNVFLLLENFNFDTDEAKRLLYVAMTRAKQNLTVHLNSNFLDNLSAENIERVENKEIHLPPNELAMHLTHKEVNLGYFEFVQHRINNIISGDTLFLKEEGCANLKGDLVLKFSHRFLETIKIQENKGYKLKKAIANYVVYWIKEETEKEVKIILPELYFEKQHDEG